MDGNKLIITGRLTNDPVSINTQSGKPMVKFPVANNRGFGENKYVNFFDVLLFGKTAETALQYLKKGKMVWVVGECRLKKYQEKLQVEIIASEFYMLGGEGTAKPADKPADQSAGGNDAPPPYDDNDIPF